MLPSAVSGANPALVLRTHAVVSAEKRSVNSVVSFSAADYAIGAQVRDRKPHDVGADSGPMRELEPDDAAACDAGYILKQGAIDESVDLRVLGTLVRRDATKSVGPDFDRGIRGAPARHIPRIQKAESRRISQVRFFEAPVDQPRCRVLAERQRENGRGDRVDFHTTILLLILA